MYLKGIFCGFNVEERNNPDGTFSRRYQYLVADGADPYTVTSEKNYSDKLQFGDEVMFSISVRAWNSRVYLNGELLER